MALLWLIIPAGIFAADEWIKRRIEKDESLPRRIWGGRLKIQRYHNRGAALNVGEKRRGLVAALSLMLTVLLLVVFIVTLGTKGGALLKTGLGFLLGGAFSNTYDRLRRKYVVDYVSFQVKWKRLAGIVFNISDFCIAIGACLYCLSEMF